MILPGDRMRLVSEKSVVYISLLYATKHAIVIFFEHQMDLGKGIQQIQYILYVDIMEFIYYK